MGSGDNFPLPLFFALESTGENTMHIFTVKNMIEFFVSIWIGGCVYGFIYSIQKAMKTEDVE